MKATFEKIEYLSKLGSIGIELFDCGNGPVLCHFFKSNNVEDYENYYSEIGPKKRGFNAFITLIYNILTDKF